MSHQPRQPARGRSSYVPPDIPPTPPSFLQNARGLLLRSAEPRSEATLRTLTLRRPLNLYPARFFRGSALGHDLAGRQHLRPQRPRDGLGLLEDGANSTKHVTPGLDPVLRRT